MSTAVAYRGDANRKQIVNLRLAGRTYDQIAEEIGLSPAAVRYHAKTWIESIAPPEERAHELRETMAARLERMHEKQWPLVLEGDAKATELALRIQAQFAKLFGLELQPGLTLNVTVTAEGMAAALGLDPQLIDVAAAEVEEITDGS